MMGTNSPYAATGRRSGRRGCGCIFGAIVSFVVLIGLVVGVGIYVESGLSLPEFLPESLNELVQGNRRISAPATVHFIEVNGESTGIAVINQPPGVRIETNDSSRTTDVPIYLGVYDQNAADTTLRWELEVDHEENPDHPRPITLSSDAQHLYAAIAQDLIAYDQGTGEERWRQPLTDIVVDRCERCLQVRNGVVVILTLDNQLQAFDATNGMPLWNHLLKSDREPNAFGFRLPFALSDSQVISLDLGSSNETLWFTFDLRSGTIQNETRPRCDAQDSRSHNASGQTLLDSDQGEIYFIFASFAARPTCLQKWDLTSGRLAYETSWPEGIEIPGGNFGGLRDLNDPSAFVAADERSLYFAVEADGANEANQLIVVDRSDGSAHLPINEQRDTILAPVASQDGIVLLQARSTRGSERDTLWAVEAMSGATLWEYPLNTSRRYAFDLGAGDAWSVALRGAEVIVIETANPDGDFEVSKLALETGALVLQETGRFDRDLPGVADLHWASGAVYAILFGDLYQIDLGTGSLNKLWP